ncbi:MAG: hypothetical protein FJX74_05250 [Armatimonadetes bacterium]|nr:hypothetical protein [Armatimonadota bacterium]
MGRVWAALLLLPALPATVHAQGLDRPWIADTYFYWYTWDYQQEFGGWVGGVWNTPLEGYYDSPSYADNLRSLRTASEWGITDHFMDYWGPGWKGADGEPREATVMRAAEELQRRGYNIHMGFYQDGEDFDMADFARNLDPGRSFRFIVENWGDSPVLPRVNRQPVHLIYSRNGAPKPTQDHAGFREWLRGRYRALDALNAAWGTSLASWEDAQLDFSAGPRRADSIRFATEDWKAQWEATMQRAREELRKPAPRVSFDVAYQPYLNWGFSALPASTAGPHSYAGIFGVPHDQDTERFINAAVAKAYGTVFFDHFKNFYHDIEIRTPGGMYSPEFMAFDRFWAGALARRSEAMLHLSWNEWWEGSNLEPCWEFGKTYCEKNLLWSSVMQQCFDSLHNWNRGAKVAVLLNDWLWLTGSRNTADVYGCVEGLRRSNVTFDLLPDDFVTRDRLANIETVIAPTGAAGLGQNAEGEPIADVLREWVSQRRPPGRGPTRRLLISRMPEYLDWLGIPRAEAKAGRGPGPTMNVFVDIGAEGDERFLLSGMTFREDWGKLPEGSFGAVEGEQTRRWTPGVGLTTTFALPFSPHRDHVLRFEGVGVRGEPPEVMVDAETAGSLDMPVGPHEYELRIPAAVVGDRRIAEVRFVYDRANVPKEIDPERYPTESRVCNLALDWLQLSTEDVPAHTREQNYAFPKEQVRYDDSAPGELRLKSLRADWTPRDTLAPLPRLVRSRHASDDTPRDIEAQVGDGAVWYCNGLLGAAGGYPVRRLVTDWAAHEPEWTLTGEDMKGALLSAGGNTRVAVVYNFDPAHRRKVTLRVPMTDRSLVEVMALSIDGQALKPVVAEVAAADGVVTITDELTYYAAYAISCGPVEADIPELTITPGSTLQLNVRLDNNEPRPSTVTLRLISPTPTLSAPPVGTDLTDYEDKDLPFEITCAPEADWGEKTVIFDLVTGGQHVYLWRKVRVVRRPEPEITSTLIDRARPQLAVHNAEHPLTASGTAERVTVTVEGRKMRLGDLRSGQTAVGDLELPSPGDRPELLLRLAEVAWQAGDQAEESVQPVGIASYPKRYAPAPGAIAPVLVFNGSARPLEDRVVAVPLRELRPYARQVGLRLHVRDESGAPVTSQQSADGAELLFPVSVVPRAARTYYACVGEGPPVPTELAITPEAVGSGHGRITVGNRTLEIVLDEQAGGVATSLRSLATNHDYGAGSFGAAYGTWNRATLDQPTMGGEALFAGTERQAQTGTPARLTLVETGPLRAVVRAEWRDHAIAAIQEYTVNSGSPWVRIASTVAPLRALAPNEELTVLDGRLKRAGLTKIFPNFVGIDTEFGKEHLHHGYRMTHFVPEYFTCMRPGDFPESVSFVLLEHSGVDAIRQGFWPAERGKAGPCELAWVELLSHGDAGASSLVDVLIHPGHQPIAAAHLNEQQHGPLVLVPKGFVFEEATP